MDKETTELMDRTKEIEIQVRVYSNERRLSAISFTLSMKVPRSQSRIDTIKNIHGAIKSRLNAKDIRNSCLVL